jgi:hypothetical protein
MYMSKIFLAVVLIATLIPIVWFVYSYEPTAAPTPPPPPTLPAEKIEIPEIDPADPKAGQCAMCAQIGDAGPKAECMENFGCE